MNRAHQSIAFLLIPLLSCAVSTLAEAQSPSEFTVHARIHGKGKILNAIVAPGPTPGSKWIYASYINLGGPLDIVAINPATGQFQVFRSPLATEHGAWAMAVGSDKAVYIGTLPSAHIMRVDWKSRRLVDLGAPSPGENYIWSLTVGSDGKLYGGTSPHAKLISFDPRSGRTQDLGRMSAHQDYARYVTADSKGFVYIGIGTVKPDVVAYEIATGRHRSILPVNKDHPGTARVIHGADGAVYAQSERWLRLSGWNAIPCPPPRLKPEDIGNGLEVAFEGSRLLGRGPRGKFVEYAKNYQGGPQEIFHVAAGPDGRVYGSTTMPFRLFWAAPHGTGWGKIGELGQGEAYSLAAWNHRLIGAAYAARAPLFVYRPNLPWQPGPAANHNPWLIHFAGENETWRPIAMLAGPQGKIYIGGLPGYGILGGSLYVLDPATGSVERYSDPVKDQSIVALAMLRDGHVIGGTTIKGGSGSHPSQHDARLFVWDPRRHKKVFETIPVPGQEAIQALGVAKSGLVYGFAGRTVFVFDPVRKKVVHMDNSGIGEVLPNALGQGPDEALYGLTHQGIFRIGEQDKRPTMLAAYSKGIDRGFAIIGGQLFFASKSSLISYHLPQAPAQPRK